jgi:hypothetical protein
MKREVVIKEEPISLSACERESPGAQMFAEVGGPFQPRASPDLAVGLFACDSDHEQAGWQFIRVIFLAASVYFLASKRIHRLF